MRTQAHILNVVIGIALAAATANADIIVFSGPMYDVVITNPVPVGANPGGENLFGFNLKIVNTTGDPRMNPAGFNGCTPKETVPYDPSIWHNLPTHTGFTTGPTTVTFVPVSPPDPEEPGYYEVAVTGAPGFHNQYQAGDSSPTLDKPAFVTDVDTHFNFLATKVIHRGTPASENNNPGVYPNLLTTNEPSNADPLDPLAFLAANDFGDRLFGHFALDGGALADADGDGDPTVWTLAYFAVPVNTTIYMDFFMTGVAPGVDVVGNFTVIPEPATLSLLAVGACLPLFRRKRG